MEPDVSREIETNLEGFLLAFCSTPASQVIREPEYRQVRTPVPLGMFNLVVGAAFPPAEAAARVAAITEQFSERGVPACWWITPSTRPENLEGLLERSGWTLSNAWQGMARELEPPGERPVLPEGLDVRGAESEAEVAAWLRVFRRGFGASQRLERTLAEAWRGRSLPFTLYLARREGEAVGTALVFRTGGVAGVYCVCTLPEARRAGVATALMHHAMEEAARQGCRLAIVQSTEMGRSLYRRLGFSEGGRFRMLDRGP